MSSGFLFGYSRTQSGHRCLGLPTPGGPHFALAGLIWILGLASQDFILGCLLLPRWGIQNHQHSAMASIGKSIRPPLSNQPRQGPGRILKPVGFDAHFLNGCEQHIGQWRMLLGVMRQVLAMFESPCPATSHQQRQILG